MKRTLFAASILVPLLAGAQPATAQELALQIVGVWKTTGLVTKEVVSGKTVHPLGERLSGYFIFAKGGHFAFINVGADRKAPATANPTDAERVDLHKTATFGSGIYRVEGNKIVARFDTSWHHAWTDTERQIAVEITANTLTTTSAPFKSSLTGVSVVSIGTYERAE
jgi:hypothetical protein